MKLHTVKFDTNKTQENFSNLTAQVKKLADENQKLRKELQDATEKQHQEMTRAIELNEKYINLTTQIHRAKEEACALRDKTDKVQID